MRAHLKKFKKINKNNEKQKNISNVIVRKKKNLEYKKEELTNETLHFSFEIDMTVRIINEKEKLISLSAPIFSIYFN